MRLLIITRNAWDDTNAIGNTLTNFFGNIKGVEFANIYFRNSNPSNTVCRLYYKTSENEVLKKWFKADSIGKKMDNPVSLSTIKEKKVTKKEKWIIHFVQKHQINIAYKISNYIWNSQKWINNNFDNFVKEFEPDLIFSFVKSSPQYYLTIKYLRENYNIPLITWIADDEYTVLYKNKKRKEINNLKYIIDNSAIVRGCSEEICNYYNNVFGCNALPLYKGCEFSNRIHKKTIEPVKLVYAGNLLYGRLDIINKMISILDDSFLNKGNKYILEIYSNTSIDEKEKRNWTPNVIYNYKTTYSKVKKQLEEANIVVFVESFEKSNIEKTKYSFSTKIIDYLQSGTSILAIGPSEISSIKYMMKIPGVCVVDNLDNLKNQIDKMFSNTFDFVQRANKIREFAKLNHNHSIVKKDIYEMLESAIIVDKK